MHNQGYRKPTVPRFTPRVRSLGDVLRGSSGRSLASIGASQGAAPVMFEAIGRMGDAIIEREHEKRTRRVVAAAEAEGANEAQRALANNYLVKLREDDTLAAQQYNKSLQARYFTDLDLRVSRKVDEIARRHSLDPGAFQKSAAEYIAEERDNLPKEWQLAFDGMAGRLLNKKTDSISRDFREWSNKENDVALLSNMDAYMDANGNVQREIGKLSVMDPRYDELLTEIKESRDKFRTALDGLSRRIDPAKRKAFQEKFDTVERRSAAIGQFEGVLASRGVAAAEVFIGSLKTNAKAIPDPDERDKLAKELRGLLDVRSEEALRKQSQEIAGQVVLEGGTLDEQRKKVRGKYEGRLEDAVMARLKVRNDEIEKTRRAQEIQRNEATWSALEATPSLDAIPPDLPHKTRAAMEKFVADRAKGAEPVTDWAEYDRLMNLSPKALAEADIYASRKKLSDTEFKEIAKRRIKYRDALAKGEDLSEPGTLTQQIAATANSFGWAGDNNAKKRGRFASKVRGTVNAEQQRLGRELTYDEREKLIGRLSKSVFVDDWFDDSEYTVGVVDAADINGNRVYVPLKDIDGADTKNAKAALVKMGVDDSDRNIEDLVAAQRLNGQRGVTDWFRSKGAKGLGAMTDAEAIKRGQEAGRF